MTSVAAPAGGAHLGGDGTLALCLQPLTPPALRIRGPNTDLLPDYARRRRLAKRGGGGRPLSLDENPLLLDKRSENLVALDAALTRLGRLNWAKARSWLYQELSV